MNVITNAYLNLKIGLRLTILCVCYSLCIIATAAAAELDSELVRYGAAALFIFLGGIFGWINIWSIKTPLNRAVGYLETMAKGDLSQEIKILRRNEISRMLHSMRKLQESMRDMLAQIQNTADGLSRASGELNTSSAKISRGTDEASTQSSAITNALADMAEASSQIAVHCQKMATHAEGTGDATRKGEQTVAHMTMMMEEIERMVVGTMDAVKALGANSERIGDIVVTIEDIADQTNLLALNAAIEAARAGEQGRGFAVVADEVRMLAERTTASTRQIQSIIGALQGDVKNVVQSMEQSAGSVRNGSEDVRHSSQAIGSIKEQIAPLLESVSQVAIAAEEQSATSADVSNSMQHIRQVVQDAAAGASHSEQSAAHLAKSAQELTEMVKRFRLA